MNRVQCIFSQNIPSVACVRNFYFFFVFFLFFVAYRFFLHFSFSSAFIRSQLMCSFVYICKLVLLHITKKFECSMFVCSVILRYVGGEKMYLQIWQKQSFLCLMIIASAVCVVSCRVESSWCHAYWMNLVLIDKSLCVCVCVCACVCACLCVCFQALHDICFHKIVVTLFTWPHVDFAPLFSVRQTQLYNIYKYLACMHVCSIYIVSI